MYNTSTTAARRQKEHNSGAHTIACTHTHRQPRDLTHTIMHSQQKYNTSTTAKHTHTQLHAITKIALTLTTNYNTPKTKTKKQKNYHNCSIAQNYAHTGTRSRTHARIHALTTEIYRLTSA